MQEQYKNYSTYWLTLELMLRMKPRLLEVADAHKLTPQQIHVLAFLGDGEPHPMSWIAALLFCDASNVTGIVDRLTALELVIRTESEQDRRVKVVRLTAKGKETRAQIMHEISIESQARIDAVLNEEEQATLRSIITKLLKATEADVMAQCPSPRFMTKK